MKNEEWEKVLKDTLAKKKKLGVKCECNTLRCSKCLMSNCKDDNCPVHTLEAKNKFRSMKKN